MWPLTSSMECTRGSESWKATMTTTITPDTSPAVEVRSRGRVLTARAHVSANRCVVQAFRPAGRTADLKVCTTTPEREPSERQRVDERRDELVEFVGLLHHDEVASVGGVGGVNLPRSCPHAP